MWLITDRRYVELLAAEIAAEKLTVKAADLTVACRRAENEADFWKREALVLGEQLVATRAVADGLARQIQYQSGPPAVLRRLEAL